MEKHVHSILAKDFQRKKRKTHKPITNKNTHKHRQVTLHTNEKREGRTLGAQPCMCTL